MVMFPSLSTTIQTNDPYVHSLLSDISRSNGEFVTSLMVREGDYFHQTGCLVQLEEMESGEHGLIQLSIRGLRKFFIEGCPTTTPVVYGQGQFLQDYYENRHSANSLSIQLSKLLKRYIFLANASPESMLQAVAFITDPNILSHFCANYFLEDPFAKQDILQTLNIDRRLRQMIEHMEEKIQIKAREQHTSGPQTHVF